MAIFGGAGIAAAIGIAMVLRGGVPIAMRLSKVGADDTIISVIKVSKKTFNKKAKDLLSLFRINTGKNKGNLSERGREGMKHPDVNKDAATQFAGNLATGRGSLTGAQRNILQRYRDGTLTRRETVKALGSAGLTASAIPAVIDAIPSGSEDDEVAKRIAAIKDPRIKALVEAEMKIGQSGAPNREDIVAGYAEAYGISPRNPDDIEVRNLPEPLKQRLGWLLGNPSINVKGQEGFYAARGEPVPARPPREPQPRGSDVDREAARQRILVERAAIAQASPRFSTEELSPYKKVAESGFGQKLFGMRRSAPEIQRDATYNSLREQGLVEEANTFLETWNTQHKEKLDAALGDAGNLTQFTKGDADRETSLREDVVRAAQQFKNISPQKTRKSKPEEVREDAQPGPFKKGGRVKPRKKVMKKMYAKGGSVRKPKRTK